MKGHRKFIFGVEVSSSTECNPRCHFETELIGQGHEASQTSGINDDDDDELMMMIMMNDV